MTDETFSQTDWTLVQRHLVGQLPQAEVDAAHEVIARDPRLQSLVSALHTTALVTSDPAVNVTVLKQRIDSERRASLPNKGYSLARVRTINLWERAIQNRVWYAASAMVLSVVLGVTIWNVGARHTGRSAAASVMTYTTGNGERATIALPDGGTVTLNVASRLEVPMDYIAGHRAVHLVGEGLFTVSHHDDTPLTVTAGGTVVRVLGTSFVVRRYATDTSEIVAVRDGKVAVGATVVTSNQLAEIGRSGMLHVRPSDGSPFTFATGTLTIDGLPLPEAITELNRWYDADIRLGDSALAKRYVQGTFGAGSLGDLAEILGTVYNVRVVRAGRVLTLYPGR